MGIARLVAALLFSLLSLTSVAQEYAFKEPVSGAKGYSRYLDSRGTPEVLLKRECSKDGKHCWSVVVNQKGKKLRSFGEKDSVISRATGRYSSIGYMLLSRSYKCGKDYCTDNLLIDSRGGVTNIGELPWSGSALATRVGSHGEIYAVTEGRFTVAPPGKKGVATAAPEPMLSGEIGYNVDGRIAAIVVAESGQLYWSDGTEWKLLGVALSAHGDRMGVASIFPDTANSHYIALYRYINEYNKGLYALHYDPTSGKEQGGWLFNSEDRNIGFDPDIYRRQGDGVVVSAKNSSDDSFVHFPLRDIDFLAMKSAMPEHVVLGGFEEEKLGSFMLGGGISQISWVANSKVKKDDVTYTDVDYLIADTLFTSANIEGRIGDTSLAINYLQNQAEDLVADEIDSSGSTTSRTLSKKASSYLFSTIDFHGLTSPTSMLRIQAEMGETNGIARVRHNDGSVLYQDFTTEMKRLALLSMRERGYFLGGDFISYTMPSAIGFSDSSKSIVYSNFDPNFGFQALRFVGGYDALAYAKRYETDYSRLYWAGSGNIGIGWAELSGSIEQDALASTGAEKLQDLPTYITMGFDLEFGYLWQQRFKRLQGLGYSVAFGYRASYSRLGAGQSEDSEPVAGTLYMEFERDDLMHGPFLKANIIF